MADPKLIKALHLTYDTEAKKQECAIEFDSGERQTLCNWNGWGNEKAAGNLTFSISCLFPSVNAEDVQVLKTKLMELDPVGDYQIAGSAIERWLGRQV